MPRTPPAPSPAAKPSGERLQRILADAGVASRRACEEMILAGRVRVNGVVLRTLPVFARPRKDRIEVDGVRIALRVPRVVIALHKPARVLVTNADEPGMDRATVIELVNHPAKESLRPAGRLAWDVNGLLILTNDGDLIHRLTHRSFGVIKVYEVVVKGAVGADQLAGLSRAAKLVGKRVARERGQGPTPSGWDVTTMGVVSATEANTLVRIALRETGGLPLTEVFSGAGLDVRRVTRVAIGALGLRGLAVGAWRVLTPAEIEKLIMEPSASLFVPPPPPRRATVRESREARDAKLAVASKPVADRSRAPQRSGATNADRPERSRGTDRTPPRSGERRSSARDARKSPRR